MPVMDSAPGPIVRIDGRELLYFAGTGYLGLQGDSRVVQAACEAVQRHGLHAATTRTGFGETPPLQAVERQAARFMDTQAALYIASGYAGMSILAQAAGGAIDRILADEWLHLAGLDAARLIGAPLQRFRHGDADDLRARLLADGQARRVLVMCDGVSPVRGDIAPIHAYLEVLAERGEGRLLVDDAHGIGVLGQNGRGSVEYSADQAGVPIAVNDGLDLGCGRRVWMCATLSKAIGGCGGLIAGTFEFISGLKARSTFYHGAAAPTAPVAGATAIALEICMNDRARRARLAANVQQLRDGLRGLGLSVDPWPTPIICVRIGDGDRMAHMQRELLAEGIAVAHSRNYPGVDHDGALRIAVFATHTPEMIERLIDALRVRV